jgi:hypothetical protein
MSSKAFFIHPIEEPKPVKKYDNDVKGRENGMVKN